MTCAHPDDCEFSCGGTISSWTTEGVRVTLLVLTDGSLGSHDASLDANELAESRQREQRTGADTLGIERAIFLAQQDGELEETSGLLRQIVATIRETRPGIIMMHDPWSRYESHPDHLAAGAIVWKAVFRAGEPRLYPELAPAWRAEKLYCFGTDEPNVTYRLSDAAFERKAAAILCHTSQYESSMGFSGRDLHGRDRFVTQLRERMTALPNGRPVEHFKILPVKPLSSHP